MHNEVKMWFLMYSDWIAKQISSNDTSFVIPKEKYEKITKYDKEIVDILSYLPEVNSVEINNDGIQLFLQ